VSCGRRVHDDRVEVVSGPALHPALFEVPDLPEHEDVFEARPRGGDVVHEMRGGEDLAEPLHVVLDVEVFLERLVRDDVHPPHAGRDLGRFVSEVAAPQQMREVPLPVDLGDAHLATGPGGNQRQRGGDGGLADPTLARDDEDLGVQELVDQHQGFLPHWWWDH
jgi:hypothetical protein